VNQNAWSRLDILARCLFPFAFTLLLVMAGMVPLRVPELSPIIPSFALIATFYWSIYRPDLMPGWAVFLLGVVQDLLTGGPVGVTSVMLLIVCVAVGLQRRTLATGSFVLVWAIFLPVAAMALAFAWLLHGLALGVLLDVRPVAFQYLTTIGAYPCCAWLFAQAQRGLLRS
jgi:rod shape-determining protein MreD